MAGLSFDEGDTPDPESPLVTWLLEWVEAVGKLAPKTVAGYVSDLAGLGAELAGVVDKALPEVYSDPAALAAAASDPAVAGLATAYGCRAGSFVRARAILQRLVLADLHPRYLARAVNRHAASHRPTSTRRAASALSSYCRYLVGQQVLAANPMASPAVEVPAAKPGDPVPLSYAEAERVVAVCGQVDPRARAPWPARDLAAYAVFVATGVRLDEAIAAAVGDLFDEPDAGARLRVWGKGSKPRTIPVHAEAGALVRAYLDERLARVGRHGADDPLLVRADGTAFSPEAMRRLVVRWYERAGVRRRPNVAVHALRRTFATQAVESGATVVELQALLGHASLETSRRYLAVVGQGLEEAVAAHASRRLLRGPGAPGRDA